MTLCSRPGKLNPAVSLVDTLNGGQFTVFAPVDTAFFRLPADAAASLQTDAARLTQLLTLRLTILLTVQRLL